MTSDSPSETFTLARTSESCISGVTVWVVQNYNKTEILLIVSAPGIDPPSLCVGQSDTLCVGQSDIPFSNEARNLGVICDSQLALKEQVNKLSTCLPGDQADWFKLTISFF